MHSKSFSLIWMLLKFATFIKETNTHVRTRTCAYTAHACETCTYAHTKMCTCMYMNSHFCTNSLTHMYTHWHLPYSHKKQSFVFWCQGMSYSAIRLCCIISLTCIKIDWNSHRLYRKVLCLLFPLHLWAVLTLKHPDEYTELYDNGWFE